MQSKLAINNLKLNVKLGVTKKERSKKQPVLANIEIIFSIPPRACKTDRIKDTFCYDQLIADIKKFSSQNEYSLIEHLGFQLFQFIKKNIPKKCRLFLAIEKKPPIIGVDSCSFAIKS